MSRRSTRGVTTTASKTTSTASKTTTASKKSSTASKTTTESDTDALKDILNKGGNSDKQIFILGSDIHYDNHFEKEGKDVICTQGASQWFLHNDDLIYDVLKSHDKGNENVMVLDCSILGFADLYNTDFVKVYGSILHGIHSSSQQIPAGVSIDMYRNGCLLSKKESQALRQNHFNRIKKQINTFVGASKETEICIYVCA